MIPELQNFSHATQSYLISRGLAAGFDSRSSVYSGCATLGFKVPMAGVECEILIAAEVTKGTTRAKTIEVNIGMGEGTNLRLAFEPGKRGLQSYVTELPGVIDTLHGMASRGVRDMASLALLQAELSRHFGCDVPTELLSKEERCIVRRKYEYITRMGCLDVVAGTFGSGGYRIVCAEDGKAFSLLYYGEGLHPAEGTEKAQRLLELAQVVAQKSPEFLRRRREQDLQDVVTARQAVETSLELI